LSASAGTNICLGGSVQLDAEGGIAYDWTPAATLDFPNLHNPTATPPVTTEYSVNITTSQVVNGSVCKFVLTVLVEVDVLSTTPISAFANPVLVTVGDPSTLVYVGQPGATVNWLPNGSTIPTTGYTVITYPQRPTTYTAVAQRGACREDVEVIVDAYTAGCATKDFFVPNTFTPNGDGNNDVLYVRSIKTEELYFAVYNRWGEMVFETNDPNKGWDGTYKGRQADVGVFGWYYKAKCANGGETFHKGNVTLIR
jgi:gliding motility-associated-like protein